MLPGKNWIGQMFFSTSLPSSKTPNPSVALFGLKMLLIDPPPNVTPQHQVPLAVLLVKVANCGTVSAAKICSPMNEKFPDPWIVTNSVLDRLGAFSTHSSSEKVTSQALQSADTTTGSI